MSKEMDPKLDLDPAAELAAVRHRRQIARRQRYRRSSLERYRAELVALRRAGGSYPDLAAWLRTRHRLTVAHTTVMRYLQGLPEMAEDSAPAVPAGDA